MARKTRKVSCSVNSFSDLPCDTNLGWPVVFKKHTGFRPVYIHN